MIELKTDKQFIEYTLEVDDEKVPSKMPAEVAEEILQRCSSEVVDDEIHAGDMVFLLDDFEVRQ